MVVQVQPATVPDRPPAGRRGWLGRVTLEPALDVVMEELLAPEQPGECLPGHLHLLGRRPGRDDRAVEGVRLLLPVADDRVELPAQRDGLDAGRQWVDIDGRMRHPDHPHLDRRGTARRHRHAVVQGCLGAFLHRIHRACAMDEVVVDAVLGIRRDVLAAEQTAVVGFVLAEQWLRRTVTHQYERSRDRMTTDDAVAVQPQRRLRVILVPPRPGVAEPQRRQHMKCRFFRPGVLHRDPHQQIPRCPLGVVDSDYPVSVLVEDAGVDQLVLRVELAAPGILRDQVSVRELALWVVVAPGVPGVRRRPVQVPPVLLDVLAVIALWAGEAEHPLLEDRIDAVPQPQ